MKSLRTLFVLLVLAFSGSALAVPITFIHTGSGAGSLAGDPFEVSNFVITAVGDTDDILNQGGYADYINHTSASITIEGVGSFDFITATRTFLNFGLNVVGFSRAGEGADLFNGPSDGAFAGWDLASSIGPIGGSGALLQWTFEDVLTDAGVLIFASGSSDATFQAIVGVPEPGTLALLGLGLVGMAAASRRRRI